MKRHALFFSFILATLAVFSSPSQAVEFREGNQYKLVQGLPAVSQPTVMQLFSIYCGACYSWDLGPTKELKAFLAKNDIAFVDSPVTFMGKYARQASIAMAITLGTPKFEQVKIALFDAVHNKYRGDWPSDEAFFETLESAGLSKKEYDANKNSMVVMKTIADWNRNQKAVTAVPSFIVNNKYLIDMTTITSYEELNELILHIIKNAK